MKSLFPLLFLGSLSLWKCTAPTESSSFAGAEFVATFAQTQRHFVGPDYWANRLQDWEVDQGAVRCGVSAPNRNLHLLTQAWDAPADSLEVRLAFHLTAPATAISDSAWVGLRMGIKGKFDDYRDNAIYGQGLEVGLTAAGYPFLEEIALHDSLPQLDLSLEWIMRLVARPDGEAFQISLEFFRPEDQSIQARLSKGGFSAEDLRGTFAIVSHFPKGQQQLVAPSLRVQSWEIRGPGLNAYQERRFGPIMFSQYTLHEDILKMTAQMAPIGPDDGQEVVLETRIGSDWVAVSQARIDLNARTATFRVQEWDSQREQAYRLRFALLTHTGLQDFFWAGTIRPDPVEQATLVVAGFTGNNDLGFPNNDLVGNVQKHDPDLLFFSGDQLYERVGGYGIQTEPIDIAELDYLHKWYIFGWTYRELMRDRPSVCLLDDHDVYHGNIWGEGGKAAQKSGNNFERQDSGGYKMPPEWVNMAQRTQTAHMPDPYDPTPVEQGIGVYYTDMVYGGISFALLEDRKFKSAPKALLPEGHINNGWAQNRRFNARRQADVQGARLLGERQLTFLDEWASDWSGGAMMKCVLSQTIFANVATLPEGEFHDKIVPKLRILKEGEYPPNDRPVADMDANGWPQSGRNKALQLMRKGFAFHLAGDQHLGSAIQYGVDDWGDAGYAFCVPAVSNIWPRRWYPKKGGKRRATGAPKYTGDFEDGFGNLITVMAVSNPVATGRKPSNLYDRATGYGIVRFQKNRRSITMECWPRDIDPTLASARQYPGWPITVPQLDNYGRKAKAWLPPIEVQGLADPVIQVREESSGDILYTLRVAANPFTAKVFARGRYTVRVGDPDKGVWKTETGIKSERKEGKGERIVFEF